MELSDEFVVGTGVDEAWRLLTDVERIAPCMPGAELQEVEGDEYRGVVKVKVGPIVAQYKGKARFVEHDETNHKAVLKADGRDVRGQGHASATVTATLSPEGDGTRVKVVTDLTITGKAAQFGRGVLADISKKLLGEFVSCLESNVLAGVPAGAQTGAQGAGPAGATDAGPATAAQEAPTGNGARTSVSPAQAPRAVDYRPTEPVDLLGTAGAPVIKRLVPAVAGVVVLFLVVRKFRGRG
jgi:carbon monoxide dehydrogenase subunit G